MKRNIPLFRELQLLFSSGKITEFEEKHKTGRSSRKFGFKEQLFFMLFYIFSQAKSMRDAVRLIDSTPDWSGCKHFGKFPLSTISDANANRPVDFFIDVFHYIYSIVSKEAPKLKLPLVNKLYSMDATVISLCKTHFDWADYRSNKSGIKINFMLDHDGYIPYSFTVNHAKKHESKMADTKMIPENSIITFDRGYNDHKFFCDLTKEGKFFVGRLKDNTKYSTVEISEVKNKGNVTSDHIVEINVDQNSKMTCRVVSYFDEQTSEIYRFITNIFDLDPEIIAQIYRERWKIELFFKEIKQCMKFIKPIGHSFNAILIQIYCSMIAYLMTAFYKYRSETSKSIFSMIQIIARNLTNNITLEVLFKSKKPICCMRKRKLKQRPLLELIAA